MNPGSCRRAPAWRRASASPSARQSRRHHAGYLLPRPARRADPVPRGLQVNHTALASFSTAGACALSAMPRRWRDDLERVKQSDDPNQ